MPQAIDPIKAYDAFINRLVDDFTYEAETTDAQKTLFNSVAQHFSVFRSEIQHLFTDYVEIMGSDEYEQHRFALRNAERWFNTAVAKDWRQGFDIGREIRDLSYPGPLTATPKQARIYLCEQVNKHCFDMSTHLAQILPHGRALSVAETSMQEVRGWLIDAVNANFPESDQAPTQETS